MIMIAQTIVKVWSDNFNGDAMTFDAYRELRLQMSTGDFHTHRYEITEIPIEDDVITPEEVA
jgi:hypothetical protein